jgi:hypothetical protein
MNKAWVGVEAAKEFHWAHLPAEGGAERLELARA